MRNHGRFKRPACLALCLVLLLCAPAGAQAGAVFSLPPETYGDGNFLLLPGQGSKAYLVSTRGNSTLLSEIDSAAKTGNYLFRTQRPYRYAGRFGDVITLASSYKSTASGDRVLLTTEVIRFCTKDESWTQTVLNDVFIENGSLAAADRYGRLYVVDGADRSLLRVYAASGALERTLRTARGAFSCIAVDPSGSRLYATYTKASGLYSAALSSGGVQTGADGELPAAGGVKPASPFFLAGDDFLCDASGGVFAPNGAGQWGRAFDCLAPLSASLCGLSAGTLAFPSGEGLLALDVSSGRPSGQYLPGAPALALCGGAGGTLILRRSGGGMQVCTLSASDWGGVSYQQADGKATGDNSSFYLAPPDAFSGDYSLPSGSSAPYADVFYRLAAENASFRAALLDAVTASVSLSRRTSGASSVVDFGFHRAGAGGQAAFCAFPSGAFPEELSEAGGEWTVVLDAALLSCGGRGGPVVRIVNDTTGTAVTRALGNGLTLAAGGAVLSFSPPETAPQAGDRFTVRIENLCAADGSPAAAEYQVKFLPANEQTPDPPEPGENRITSDVYRIDRSAGTITGISAPTTLSAFKKGLRYPAGSLRILKGSFERTSGGMGTGMQVQLVVNGEVEDSLFALVFGDLTGEGNVNTLDFRALLGHLLGEEPLSGLALKAADLNHDGRVDPLDLLALRKNLSGTYDIAPFA